MFPTKKENIIFCEKSSFKNILHIHNLKFKQAINKLRAVIYQLFLEHMEAK